METLKIKQSELEALLTNEETVEVTLEKYFNVHFPQPFEPVYELKSNVQVISNQSEDEVLDKGLMDVVIGVANKMARRKRRKLYHKTLSNYPNLTRIVSEGDSWFQHPHPKVKDTIDHLSDHYAIYSVGAACDELKNMFREQEYKEAIQAVKPQFFLLSGGGNDILGEQFRHFLKSDFPAAPIGENPKRFIKNAFFSEVDGLAQIYRYILENLTTMNPDMHILLHGYDYIIPESSTDSGWLGRYMIEKGISEHDDRQALINLIIDCFFETVSSIADSFEKVHFIDCRTVVPNDQWYDEIHPNSDGFALVADRFRKKIEEINEQVMA